MFNLSLLNNIQDKYKFEDQSVELSTDSRKYENEELFFCLYGEHFDGFDFCEQVIEKKCKNIIFRSNDKNLKKKEELSKKYNDVKFIEVKDPILFLQDLAKEHIKSFKEKGHKVIGITGSNGKTTTKEMLHFILSKKFGSDVFATIGNLNNHIGVPLTILGAPENCKVLIVEMGSNHLGEIRDLCEIASPESGIISSVGAAHIGLFGSIENIFKEKSSLYEFILENKTNNSVFIVNNNDKYLSRLESNSTLKKFGKPDSDYVVEIEVANVSIKDSKNEMAISNEYILEKYNLENLVSTLLLAINLYPDSKPDFIRAANEFKMPSLNRSEWIEKSGKTFFLDAYNANPTSMAASLTSFVENLKRRGLEISKTHFILGDMNELGDFAKEEHNKIGLYLKELGASSVTFVGNYAHFYQQTFTSSNCFKDKSELIDAWPVLLSKHEAFFIKASRSLQLESLIDIT
jgi:UDP-N-acetylmuramoyl-tripeptide--D-alanyl-D-alanine ligase